MTRIGLLDSPAEIEYQTFHANRFNRLVE